MTIRVFLGGSFDPVHIGHMAMLQRVYQTLQPMLMSHRTVDSSIACDSETTNKATNLNITPSPHLYASFLPTARSPLKSHSSASKHRLAMLQLACHDTPFSICDIEIIRPAPTYTIDTLRLLRKRHPNDCLIFVLGADSAMSLSLWRQGLRLTDYSHLWVLPRLGLGVATDTQPTHNSLVSSLPKPLQHQVTQHLFDLKNTPCGHIYIDNTDIVSLLNNSYFCRYASNSSSLWRQLPNAIRPTIPEVSSSNIRASIASHHLDYARANLQPQVLTYILEHDLYSQPI